MSQETKGSGYIQQELDEMMEEVVTEEPKEEEPKVEAPKIEEPEIQATEEPKEVVKEESIEQPAVAEEEASVSEEPSKEVKGSEKSDETTSMSTQEEDLKHANEALRSQIETLSKNQNQLKSSDVNFKNGEVKTEAPPKPNQGPEVAGQSPPQPKTVEDNVIDFVNEDTFAEIQNDSKKMNRVLTKVYNLAVENTYKNTPKLVDNMIKQRTFLNDKVDTFYKVNEDLLPYRQFVGFVANELASQNPDWEIDAVFDKTASEVRTRLGIKKKIVDKATLAKTKPAFAQAKKSNSRESTEKPNLTEMEQQIQDMLDD